MGVISPVGNDVRTFWDSLVHGVNGIGFISEFPTEELPVKIAGMVRNFDGAALGLDKAFVRKQDKFAQYGMAAAIQAMEQSGLRAEGEDANIDPFRLGV